MPGAPQSNRQVDAVVIGGGPAGATAARLLAAWGRSVCVLDRAHAGPGLAESLTPSCAPLLDHIGIRAAVDRGGFVRSSGNTVIWAGGARRVEPFAAGRRGWQVERDRFDALLLEEAEAAGAMVKRGTSATTVRGDADAWFVQWNSASGDGEIAARWVLDCTGRAGLLARRGWRALEPALRTVAVVGVWGRDDAWPTEDDSHTIVESYEGGWAWSVPMRDHRRQITVMLDPRATAIAARQELQAMYLAELVRVPGLQALSTGARLESPPFGLDASPYGAVQTAQDGLLLVGDAASFVDPLSSFGLKKAMASAWLAAVVVHTALSDRARTAAALELYEAREREMTAALRAGAQRLAQAAAGAHPGMFWEARSGATFSFDAGDDTPPEAIAAAHRQLTQMDRASIRLAGLARVPRGTVVGNEIVLLDHLVTLRQSHGTRFIRSVDLVRLAEVAAGRDDVGEVYEAYRSTVGPVQLSDFLWAIAWGMANEVFVVS